MANHHGDLDLDTADRLLSGRLDVDDVPPEYRAVAELFHDAQREPVPYRGRTRRSSPPWWTPSSPTMSHRGRACCREILALKVAAIAVVALSATAAAAATGSLPDAAQDGLARAVQHVGINLPSSANDHARERTEDQGPNADEPVNTPASTAGDDEAGTETDGSERADESAGTADPTAPAPLADAQPPAAPDNHGATVSDTAHQADPAGGKGEEVAPVAQDNPGAEARTEHQPEHPETPAPGGANPNGNNAVGGNGNGNGNTNKP